MSVATETQAVKVLNVSAGTPIPVNFPLYATEEVFVYYGEAALLATLNTDYTVTLGTAPDFFTFTLTPTAALLTKINDLIAADPTETNFITIRRTLPLTTATTPSSVANTVYTSREIDRITMKLQQLQEKLLRSVTLPPTFVGTTSLILYPGVADQLAMYDASGNITPLASPKASQLASLAGVAEARALVYPALPALPVYDAGNRRIGNVGPGSASNDAVTLRQVGIRFAFDEVTNLLADLTMGYVGSGAEIELVAGNTGSASDFRYRVALAAATDHHVITAGGVKLYVLRGKSGKHYAEAWGAIADGVTDCRNIIQSIIDKTTGTLTVVLGFGTTLITNTIYLRRSRTGIEGAGPGGQSFLMFQNAAGGRVFAGDTDHQASMNTYTGNFLRDFEVLSTGVEGNDASIVVDITSFSYGTFGIRAQSKRPNAILYYGQGNNGASPYYNHIYSTGLFGWTDQTQIAFVFEHGLWSGGSPGPNSNFIGPITEAPLFKNFLHCLAGQANHFTNLGIESIKDAYFVLGGRPPSDTGGFSSGGNTHLLFNDTAKAWAANIHSGSTLRTVGGTGPAQYRKITSNSATQLTLQDPFAVIPGTDTSYEIYKPYAISNHFSHIRGEDTNVENPEFVRAWWDSDDFSFDSWYVDSIGIGSLFEDYTGSTNNKVFGSRTLVTYTFKNPGPSATVEAWERNSSNGGLPLPGKIVPGSLTVSKSLGNTGGTITVNLDFGGGASGGGTPALLVSSPKNFASGMDLPLATEFKPIVGINNPAFLTLTTGSDVVATEDFTVTVAISMFD